MTTAIEGLDELRSCLGTLADKSAKKAAKAGVNAGLGVLSKEIKSAVNGLPISGELKAALRATVNKRLRKKEGEDWTGKAGFGVGKTSPRKKEAAHARAARGQGGTGEQRGVGISSANVHWLIGTKERHTDSGHRTGAMPDVLSGLIAEAADSAGPAMIEAARQKISQVLASEAQKAKKG